MKKVFALLAMVIGLAACAPPTEISMPDSNVKHVDGAIVYKDKPYTGKITTNLADKVQGYSGFINLKEGHLDGLTEVTGKNGEKVSITIANGKFEGDYIVEQPNVVKVFVNFKNGQLKVIKMDAKGMNQDLTVAEDGKLDGTIVAGGQTITLKNGVANINKQVSLKASIQGDKLIMETYQGDKLLQKQEENVAMTPTMLEQQLFPAIVN